MATDRLEGPFRRNVLLALTALAASSLGLGLALIIVGPEGGEAVSAGADAFSRSAIGHRAFVQLLQARGIPVVVSRHDSGRRAGSSAVLVLAEPRIETPQGGQRIRAMLASAKTTLLVLPKWTGRASPSAPGWLDRAELVPEPTLAATLFAARVPARVSRPEGSLAEHCAGADEDVTWAHPQLLSPSSSTLRPLVTCRGGVLLGEIAVAGSRLLVLSDPDLLSNHGLGEGDNARLALSIVEGLRRPGQALVVDETLHGHEQIPSLWRELFKFPLLPSVLQGARAPISSTVSL